MAAAEAATSADEEVVCEGEKTRDERDAELRGEAVSLDELRVRQCRWTIWGYARRSSLRGARVGARR